MQRIIIFIIAILLAATCSCTTTAVVDTGDIQRLQRELEHYRAEYERAIEDNKRLTERGLEMAEATTRATTELGNLNASTIDEVSKLREYIRILEQYYYNTAN